MTTQDKPAVGPLSASDVKLLPCPFCEGDVIVTDSQECQDAETYYWHRCAGCGVESEGAHGASAARDQWNMRPQPFRLAPTAPVEAGAEDDDLKLIIAHTIIEDLRVQHPGIEQIDNERGDIWIPGGSTPQSSGCTVDIHSVAQAVEQQVRATFAPGHTDLMVSPESIDAFLEVNPPPVEAGGSERGDALLRRAKGMKALGAHSITVRIDELEAALRPQPSGETLQSLAQAFEDAMEGTHGAWAVSGDEGQAGGSDAAKLLAYEDAYQVALELGYPSLTEALEHLAELTPAIPASEGGEG